MWSVLPCKKLFAFVYIYIQIIIVECGGFSLLETLKHLQYCIVLITNYKLTTRLVIMIMPNIL